MTVILENGLVFNTPTGEGVEYKYMAKDKVEKSTVLSQSVRVRRRVQKTCKAGSSKTMQQFVKDCDFNAIVQKALRANVWPPQAERLAAQTFTDVSHLTSYQDSIQLVQEAQEMFLAIPARIRARFDNDPAKFIAFASDQKNGAEMVKLGLAHITPEFDAWQQKQKKNERTDSKSQPQPAVGEGPKT